MSLRWGWKHCLTHNSLEIGHDRRHGNGLWEFLPGDASRGFTKFAS